MRYTAFKPENLEPQALNRLKLVNLEPQALNTPKAARAAEGVPHSPLKLERRRRDLSEAGAVGACEASGCRERYSV